MSTLEESFAAACSSGKIPGAVLVATDTSGSFTYSEAFGFRSLEDDNKLPMELDTLMTLASCTKLITTIAALQLVERGHIGLGDDVADILPELSELEIFQGMMDGKGVLNKRKNPITLRHLLTHSSGAVYHFMSPGLSEYMNSIGQGAMASPQGVIESFSSPLIFEPGSSWQYSTGLDWTGLLISRLSKTNLETFYQLNIFEPLGIEDITFWPDRKPELSARKATVSIRDPKVLDGSGKVIPFKGLSYVTGGKEELGGQGAYASMPSYLKILHSLLADDEKLLKKETTATMFEPQLTEKSQEVLQNIYKNKPMKGPCSIGNFPSDVKYDWGFGGLLTMQDINTDGVEWRRKGTLNWSGMLNLYWFIDREADICGIYGGQVMPPGDLQVKEMMRLFEMSMYQRKAQNGKH